MSCFWIHDWSKWRPYQHRFGVGGITSAELRQCRHCKLCGYTQDMLVARSLSTVAVDNWTAEVDQ